MSPRRIMGSLILALILAFTAGAGAAEPNPADPAALAAKIQERYQGIQAMTAAYQRKSVFVAAAGQAGREVTGAGQLSWQRPTFLRLDQTEPKKELVVAGSDGVWWVRPRSQKADLYDLESFTAGLRSMLDALSGLAAVDQQFDLHPPDPEEAALAPGALVLVLTPKEARADLSRLIVWFDPAALTLRGFRLLNIVGDVTDYRFENVVINPDLDPGLFTYAPPDGFRVRDHRTLNPR